MRKSTRRELNKLRELFWYFIAGKKCARCHELFVPADAYEMASHGDCRGEPVSLKITIHHRDHDHSNNDRRNHSLMHNACHKALHAKRAAREKGQFSNGTQSRLDRARR